ncbi:MAG: hypothetical protein KKF77_00665 [Proteobacteria bacterium]|nr:hypothetical protein [Pseudomonadota bacterium]
MRRILTGLLACVLTLGLLAAGQAEAKVYKMKPEERAAALKEKKARKARKKAGKTNAAAPGGWVEVKPGSKPERKVRKSAKVDEAAAEKKGRKSKKSAEAEAKPEKKAGQKSEKKSEKKSGKKGVEKAASKTEKKSGKRSRKEAAAKGDRLVTKSYAGETKVRGEGIEVRRTGAKTRHAAPAEAPAASTPATPPGDDLSGYSVKRPGQDKPVGAAAGSGVPPAVAPEVRQPVQPGPVDSAKPVGTEQKAGEGRF